MISTKCYFSNFSVQITQGSSYSTDSDIAVPEQDIRPRISNKLLGDANTGVQGPCLEQQGCKVSTNLPKALPHLADFHFSACIFSDHIPIKIYRKNGKSNKLTPEIISLNILTFFLFCCCSATKSCPALCNPMDCNMPYFPVLYCLSEFSQTHVH